MYMFRAGMQSEGRTQTVDACCSGMKQTVDDSRCLLLNSVFTFTFCLFALARVCVCVCFLLSFGVINSCERSLFVYLYFLNTTHNLERDMILTWSSQNIDLDGQEKVSCSEYFETKFYNSFILDIKLLESLSPERKAIFE